MSEYIIVCDEEVASWIGNDVDSMKEVVRCRDCKHYRDRNGAILPSTVCQRLGYYNFKVEPYGFCSWGERRGE